MLALCFCSLAFIPRQSVSAAKYIPRVKSIVAQQFSTRGLDGYLPDQQKAINEAFLDSVPTLVPSSTSDDTWDAVRAKYPPLSSMTDVELSDAFGKFITAKPSLGEVLLKTPVGPVILINVLLLATSKSACDLPWADTTSTACVELAARLAQ